MKKKVVYLILIFILFVSIAGCMSVFKTRDIENIETIVCELSSDKYKGRLAGTKENKKAAEFIESVFKEKGFVPYYKDKFTMAYDQTIALPENKISELLFIDKENKVVSLKYGKEYLEQAIFKELNLEGNITFNLNDEELNEKILVVDNIRVIGKLNKSPKAIFIRAEYFKKNLSINNENVIPIIQISSDIYTYLKMNTGIYIKYESKNPITEVQAYNVVSKVNESKSKRAVVLSAHFDHVGYIDDVIFSGAIDNASGVSLMIDIGNKLKKYTKNHSLDYDIIMCAFNGEETDRQGSREFITSLTKGYEIIYNINFDSIGIKNGGKILLSSNQSNFPCFVDIINKTLQENHLDTSIIGTEYVSDHVSFLDANVPSISIGQENIQKIHTLRDTISEIDFTYLENLGKIIFDFIIEKSNRAFEEVTHSHKNSTLEIHSELDKNSIEIFEREVKKLKYLQYKTVNTKNGPQVILNSSSKFTNLESINKYYPNMKFPLDLQGYKFEYVDVTECVSIPQELRSKMSINNVYDLKGEVKNIEYINLVYSKIKSNQKETLTFLIIDEDIEENNNEFTTKDIISNTKLYTIKFIQNTNRIFGISFKFKSQVRSYDITIFRGNEQYIKTNGEKKLGYLPNWFDNSIDDSIKFIDILKMDTFMNNLLN